MRISDFFKKKQNQQSLNTNDENTTITFPNNEETIAILTDEIESFFPQSGRWARSCYSRPTELTKSALPCHLTNTKWMAELMAKELLSKGKVVRVQDIENFLETSERFQELRHNYELEIVKWQIDYMRNDGEGYLLPKGHDEISFLTNPNIAELFRESVVRTLSAIGISRASIEEGLERNSAMWLESYLRRGFANAFEPTFYYYGSPDPASEQFKKDWLKLKRHTYYTQHKKAVDLFNDNAATMRFSQAEVARLYRAVPAQSVTRRQQICDWQKQVGLDPTATPPYPLHTEEESSF